MIFDSKCRQRSKNILSFLMVIVAFSFVTKCSEAARDRGARCEKPEYLPNGDYRIRRDRVMRITCNSGFLLQGPKTIDCIRGKWDGEKPVCAKKGCKKDVKQPENGRIQIEKDVKAILYCSDNYNLAGNRYMYCNGSHWDRPIGSCRERKNVVPHACDFETDDICGWTYEPREGLEWKRVMAANVFTTFKTGPRHDHTTLTANGGHYMLMESLSKQNDYVTLTSPIYDQKLSLKTACCFKFYYFMYGAGVGDLFVVVKPVSMDLDDLLKDHKDLIKFQKYGNQNNIWNEAQFSIEEFDEDFQILFVAKSGHGQLSDIAIDDVKLSMGDECKLPDKKDDEDLSNEEYDSTTYESIFEMESCAGRCFESPGSGLIRTFGHLKGLCNCDIDCEDNETCCPDFRAVCLNELFSQSTPLSEADDANQNNESARSVNNITTKATTTSTTTKTTLKTTTTEKNTPTTKTTPRTSKITPTTTTTIKITPTTIVTTKATIKTTPTTVRTTPTTIKTTPFKTTTTTTTTKPLIVKTTKTTTPRLTTPTTTTRKTTSTTTSRKTTARTTSRKTTPTTTKAVTKPSTTKTTPKTTPTTRKVTSTTKTAQKTTTKTTVTVNRTTPLKKDTTPATTITAKGHPDITTTRKPIPTSKSIEYVMKDKSKTEASNKTSSSLLLCTFFIIVIVILVGAAYKRFGERGATRWSMIQFNQNTSGDEDSSSIITSFKRPQTKASGSSRNHENVNGKSKSNWLNKLKNSTNRNNNMKTPLIDDDDDDDDDIGANGNFQLENDIYTEL